MCKKEGNLEYQAQGMPTNSFETVPPIALELANEAKWLRCPRDLPASASPELGIQTLTSTPGIYMGSVLAGQGLY